MTKALSSTHPAVGVLLHLPEAAARLGISVPTLKQWIYKKKIHSSLTPGGHHRIPLRELDRLLGGAKSSAPGRRRLRTSVSGRNQLVGRVESVTISGLMAEVVLSFGEQHITSIITASAVREMNLRPGQTAAALIKSTEVMILRV